MQDDDYSQFAFDETAIDATDPAFYRYNATRTDAGIIITRGEQFGIDAVLGFIRDALETGVPVTMEAPK